MHTRHSWNWIPFCIESCFSTLLVFPLSLEMITDVTVSAVVIFLCEMKLCFGPVLPVRRDSLFQVTSSVHASVDVFVLHCTTVRKLLLSVQGPISLEAYESRDRFSVVLVLDSHPYTWSLKYVCSLENVINYFLNNDVWFHPSPTHWLLIMDPADRICASLSSSRVWRQKCCRCYQQPHLKEGWRRLRCDESYK